MKVICGILVLISVNFCSADLKAQEKLVFRTVDEVLTYAGEHSQALRNAGHQSVIARNQTLASQWNQFNLRGQASFSVTENIQLNTNFIPAELVGGPAGTFRPVTFGQKHESRFAFTPQIDLFNPYAAALIRTSKSNEELTRVNNLLDKRALYESIAAAYYNILSYQWQLLVTRKSFGNADTLCKIFRNKHQEGTARGQDVNIALANRLTVQDKLQQLEVQLEQQYNNLKLLTDIDSAIVVRVSADNEVLLKAGPTIKIVSNLLQRQAEWQIKYNEASLRADKRWFYPTVSLFSSFGTQQVTNNHFFDGSRWFGTSYIGLRLNLPLLPEPSRVIAVRNARINLQIARNTEQHSILQDKINNNQLGLDEQKAVRSYQAALDIETLRKDAYDKNLNIYHEGILSAIDLINSFDDWLNSSLNAAAQKANALYARSRINIYNTIK